MEEKSRSLTLNSATAYVLAVMVVTTLHELAHLVAGLLLGEKPAELYPNAVHFPPDISDSHHMVTAAAGPAFSLLLGLLLISVARNWGRGFVRLFWLWAGFTSLQIGFGYLIICFAGAGDTGTFLSLADAPSWLYVLVGAAGVAGMLWTARGFARQAVRYTSDTSTLRQLGLMAWLIGTGVTVGIYGLTTGDLTGDEKLLVLLGVFSTGFFTPLLTFFYKKFLPFGNEKLALRKVPVVGLVAVVAVAVFLVFVLAGGLSVG